MTKKHTIDFVIDYFTKQGYTCLETEYVDSRKKIRYRCNKHHEDSMSFNHFYNNNIRCPVCSGVKPHTIDFVKDCFAKIGYTCLETQYVNNSTKINYKCDKNHFDSMTFDSFYNGNQRCPVCSGKKKHTIEFVIDYFSKQGYTCLETEYINNQTNINYKCDKHHFDSMTFGNFYNRNSRCLVCSGLQKHTIEFVIDFFAKFGYTCLATEYVNNKKKMRYKCDKDHFDSMTFGNFYHRNNRCPKCRNKTEQIVNDFLEANYSNVVCQPKFEWCKNKRHLPFDFLLEHLKILIEVDGPQHFRQIGNWKAPEENLERDVFKTKMAIENGYSVIRISQEDIYNNTIDWQEQINENVSNYPEPVCVYISKNPVLYDNHKLLMDGSDIC
jgi:very-short-patch-repair endonuclease